MGSYWRTKGRQEVITEGSQRESYEGKNLKLVGEAYR
jgi:hypothetical protein